MKGEDVRPAEQTEAPDVSGSEQEASSGTETDTSKSAGMFLWYIFQLPEPQRVLLKK